VSKEITVNDKRYRHLISLMSMPGHFWSVLNIDSRIFFGELDPLQKGLLYRGHAPFVTQCQEDGKRVQSAYHIYGVCEDLNREDDGMEGVTGSTKKGVAQNLDPESTDGHSGAPHIGN
jgi:hypothetical protein